MSHVKIHKFGGTSLGNTIAIKRSAEILLQDNQPKVIVVSALAGVTKSLIQWYITRDDQHISDIRYRHNHMVTSLGLKPKVLELLETIYAPLYSIDPSKADVLSIGEYASSLIFYYLLKDLGIVTKRIDICELLIFSQHELQRKESSKRCKTLISSIIAKGESVITQGFFVWDKEKNERQLLGRGGSDYTAGLLGDLISARSIHIWTDVLGVFSVDPNICNDAKYYPRISAEKATKAFVLGAKVIHPQTLIPLEDKQIPVYVGHSQFPTSSGTWIEWADEIKPQPILGCLKPPGLLPPGCKRPKDIAITELQSGFAWAEDIGEESSIYPHWGVISFIQPPDTYELPKHLQSQVIPIGEHQWLVPEDSFDELVEQFHAILCNDQKKVLVG